MHSYKAGNQAAKEMSDSEALKYADDFNIPLPAVSGAPGDDQAIAEQLQPPPVVEESKTPKKGGARKRKSGADEVEAPSAVKPAAPASPDKKRKRESKVAETKEEPKKARGKKAGKA